MDIEKKDIAFIHQKAHREFERLCGSEILLTGGGGFLSYYIIKSIAIWNHAHTSKKISLVVYSRFNQGIPTWLTALKSHDIQVKKKDVTTLKIPKSQSFEYIIHAASIASPIAYRKDPINTINANVTGLQTLLRYMLARKDTARPVKGLLYFSSSEIYGDPPSEYIPTPETYRGNVSCTGPRACYDESKRFCETLCATYASVHGLPIKIARPFNNYGPGLKITDGRVIPDFSKNILANRDIIMYSDGTPSRTFCYVADAIAGYMKILVNGGQGEAYNIGTEHPEISMKELAKLMVQIGKETSSYKGTIVMKVSRDKQYLTDNPIRRKPDISKARKGLGYLPQITLQDGLTRTLTWYKESLGVSL